MSSLGEYGTTGSAGEHADHCRHSHSGRRTSRAASSSSTTAMATYCGGAGSGGGIGNGTTATADEGTADRPHQQQLSLDASGDGDMVKSVDSPPPPPLPPPPPPVNEEVTYMDDDDLATVVVDRDPFRWHEIVKVKFEDIFGEPDPEVYSVDRVWKLSSKAYCQTKRWCYRLLSLLFAIPLAIVWGLFFSCQSFLRIWVCVPCLKASEIQLHCLRRLIEALLRTFVAPCFEAVGRCFYHLRLRILRDNDSI